MFSSYYVKGTFVNPRTNIANAYYQTGEKYLFGLIFITKDGNQTSVKCLTYVTLKESNYNYLFLWRNKMRGVYPVLKLSTKDEKKSILSTFAEIGVVGVKLVRAKRKSINRSHVWTFLGSHAFRH
jgi:hypothetical protein